MHSGVLVCAVVEDQPFHWWLRSSAYSMLLLLCHHPGGVGVRVVLFRSLLKALTETPRYATVF